MGSSASNVLVLVYFINSRCLVYLLNFTSILSSDHLLLELAVNCAGITVDCDAALIVT